MNTIFADVILYDEVGSPYTGDTIINSGLGGSEFQSILLLEELAKRGKRVVCLNNIKNVSTVNGVLYVPNTFFQDYSFICNNLIIHRYSSIPPIKHKKAFIWSTDLNGPHHLKFYNAFNSYQLELITLSKFHNNLFPPQWKKHVIPFVIPDWIYEYKIPKHKSNYIYASSIMKGLSPTLDYWRFLKHNNFLQNKTLYVCCPGYDNPSNDSISDRLNNIVYLNTLPLNGVVEKIASCEGMFYVNTVPETFGISVVLAELLQTTPFVYGINGLGALPELIWDTPLTTDMKIFIEYFQELRPPPVNKHEFRMSDTILMWESLLVS